MENRRPVLKNCRFCGRFMEFFWAEVGSELIRRIYTGNENSMIPVFYCRSCHEVDNEFIDPKCYEWLVFAGTIDFEDPEIELSEFIELLVDDCIMQENFRNRPYLAIPKLE